MVCELSPATQSGENETVVRVTGAFIERSSVPWDMSRSPRERNKLNLTRRQVLESSGVGPGVTVPGFSQTAVSRARKADPPEHEGIDVIRESMWVETDTDTDNSGEPDRTHVDIARPARTENEKLPVVMRADPYAVPDRDGERTALADDDGAGFGVVSTLAWLGGISYLLGQQRKEYWFGTLVERPQRTFRPRKSTQLCPVQSSNAATT